jgi:signal transduction histidine kinase
MTVTPIDGLSDLKEVIEAYNGLAERLTESQRALQKEVLRLRRELVEKNRQLARKNRLEVLGEMAAGVAHEIRNPLGGIELYAGLIAREGREDERIAKWAGQIHRATRNLASIVGDILDFTRPVRPKIRPVQLTRVVGAALELAAGALEENRVAVSSCEDTPNAVAAGDPNLLQRAFLNIILNAADAMPRGGMLKVSAFKTSVGEQRGWAVRFTDTGPGLPPEDIDRVFDPFFTAKEGGTGLGLAMVARIVEAHDGSVDAGNAPEGGAVFTVSIPAGGAGSRGESR